MCSDSLCYNTDICTLLSLYLATSDLPGISDEVAFNHRSSEPSKILDNDIVLGMDREALIIALGLSKTASQLLPEGILLTQGPGSQLTTETSQLGLS